MRVTPRSEEECKKLAFSLLDKGRYQAQLIMFNETDAQGRPLVSQTGNAKTDIRLKVWDIQGKEHTIFDNLTDHEKMAYKTRHFAEAFGLVEEYKKGELPGQNKIGELCLIDVTIQKGKARPEGGFYDDKNAVVDYMPPDPHSTETLNKPGEGLSTLPSDEIPF